MFFKGIKRDIEWLKEGIDVLEERTRRFERYEKQFFAVMENYESNMKNEINRLEKKIKK